MKYNKETGEVEASMEEIVDIIRGAPAIQDYIKVVFEATQPQPEIVIQAEKQEFRLTPETTKEVMIKTLEMVKMVNFDVKINLNITPNEETPKSV